MHLIIEAAFENKEQSLQDFPEQVAMPNKSNFELCGIIG